VVGKKEDVKKGWSTRRKIVVGLIVGAVVLVGAIVGVSWWLHARHFEKTDDAFIDVHAERVGPQVAGRVARVLVEDNQFVEPGQTLIEIDPADYLARVEQARAAVAQADAAVKSAAADVEQAKAEVEQARTSAENARTELARSESLPAGAVSAQQLDNLRAAARNAAAQVTVATKRQAAAEAQVDVAAGQTRVARAQLAQAQLSVSYTTVRATVGGRVSNRHVQAGDYVQVGQEVMTLVPREVWVTANFKETQLTDMRPGQPVTVEVDAYPDVEFAGRVDSIQKGTGAVFSLLPPENATGNFVKVVQRVPVKIVLDRRQKDQADYDRLAPGMSVVPKVRVR
jgi:membrane fusion protein (multidrug efflux system)